MAKAARVKTRTPGVFKVGDRYEWISYRSQTSGTCDLYGEAAAAKQAADAKGPTPERARGTFGEYARQWVEAYGGRTRRGFGEASRQRYRENLELYAIPFFDRVRKRRFADIKRADLKAFVTWLERHEQRDGAPLTAETIDRTLAPLSAMYNDAIDDGIYHGQNPVRGVRANVRADEVDPDEDDDKRALTVEQLSRVLGSAGEHELMLTLLADTGIRWGELSEVRGHDLKTTRQGPVLAVRRAWDAKTKTIGRPKGGKVREIPLSPDLARRLWRLQRQPSELLFVSPFGERLNYQNTLRRVLRPILTVASVTEDGEVDDLTWAAFHAFRHTFATLSVDAGANVKRVSKMLGHHKASFTLDYYTHLFADDQGPVVNVSGLVAATPGGSRPMPNTKPFSQLEDRERELDPNWDADVAAIKSAMQGQAGGRSGAGCAPGTAGNSPEAETPETGDLRDKDPVSLERSEATGTP